MYTHGEKTFNGPAGEYQYSPHKALLSDLATQQVIDKADGICDIIKE